MFPKKVEKIRVILICFYTFVDEDKNSGFCLHIIETISILYVLQFSKSGVLWRIGKNEIVCKCLYDSGAGFTTLFYQG